MVHYCFYESHSVRNAPNEHFGIKELLPSAKTRWFLATFSKIAEWHGHYMCDSGYHFF
jgi:hypothetical protein